MADFHNGLLFVDSQGLVLICGLSLVHFEFPLGFVSRPCSSVHTNHPIMRRGMRQVRDTSIFREEMTHLHNLRTTKALQREPGQVEVFVNFNMVMEVGSNFRSKGVIHPSTLNSPNTQGYINFQPIKLVWVTLIFLEVNWVIILFCAIFVL